MIYFVIENFNNDEHWMFSTENYKEAKRVLKMIDNSQNARICGWDVSEEEWERIVEEECFIPDCDYYEEGKYQDEYKVADNWNALVQKMDDTIREELHNKLSPCSEMQFLKEYCNVDNDYYQDVVCQEFDIDLEYDK